MLIHLMQHGVCLSKELDVNQPLSPVGREQIEKSARAAQILGLQFELILASPKVRSLQTAEIMAQHTGYPVSRIEVTEAVKAMTPAQTTIDFIHEYDGLDSVLIAGHLPSLSNVASTILSGGNQCDIHIENGSLIQIELNASRETGTLNWHLSAVQLALIAKN